MALQCSICLESQSTCPDWSVLVTCGHVFHSNCLLQSLEYRKCCPCCRANISNVNRDIRRLYPQLVDPGEGTPARPSDVQQYHWRAELLDKDREIQQLKVKLLAIEELSGSMDQALQKSKERVKALQSEAACARDRCIYAEKECKRLAQNVQSMKEAGRLSESRAVRIRLADSPHIVDAELEAELELLTSLDCPAPSFFKGMLDLRNRQLLKATNRLIKLERETCALRNKLATAANTGTSARPGVRVPTPATSVPSLAAPASSTKAGEGVVCLSSDDEVEVLLHDRALCDMAAPRQEPHPVRSDGHVNLARAGPSVAMAGAGSSFVRDRHRVNMGARDDASFIVQGPDGMGGRQTILRSLHGHSNRQDGIHRAGPRNDSGSLPPKRVKQSHLGGPGGIQSYFRQP
ncbi:hypothetical protein ACKKBG_A01270 [Auxenochlorella protothecoides x Auxenochlorella symbiontica]